MHSTDLFFTWPVFTAVTLHSRKMSLSRTLQKTKLRRANSTDCFLHLFYYYIFEHVQIRTNH